MNLKLEENMLKIAEMRKPKLANITRFCKIIFTETNKLKILVLKNRNKVHLKLKWGSILGQKSLNTD